MVSNSVFKEVLGLGIFWVGFRLKICYVFLIVCIDIVERKNNKIYFVFDFCDIKFFCVFIVVILFLLIVLRINGVVLLRN